MCRSALGASPGAGACTKDRGLSSAQANARRLTRVSVRHRLCLFRWALRPQKQPFILFIFLFPPFPLPSPAYPSLPPRYSSLRIQAGPPGHTAPLTVAPAHPALLERLLATVASSILRPRPAPSPPHLPCAWLGLCNRSSGRTHPGTGPGRQPSFARASGTVAPGPSRLKQEPSC